MLSSVEQAFVGRDEIRAPLETPAWEGGGGWWCRKKLFWPFGPQFGATVTIRGGEGRGASPGSDTARHFVRKVPISIPRCDQKSFSRLISFPCSFKLL